jgi:FAD/FMN-containing dehydrogenase
MNEKRWLTRRTVLAAGGAGLVTAAVGACAHRHGTAVGQQAATAPSGGGASTSRSSSPRPADWAVLRGELPPGALVRPGEPGYGKSRLLFDPRFDRLRPAGIAYCRSAADVSACVAFARRFAVPVAARSGGHSYGGWSSSPGLIIDVSRLNSFAVSGAAVMVGTGTKLIDFYSQLAGHGLAVPGGSCPTVGISGLTLGGGVGVLGRALGLTCDNLQSLQLVTADGRVRQVDPGHDPDLLWASRGGGGGNFGVATSLTFTAHPLTALTQFFLSWPWSQVAKVIAGWQAWAPRLGEEFWSNMHLSAAPGAAVPLTVQVGGTFLGSPSGASAALDKLFAAVGSAGDGEPFEAPYLHAMLIEAGCSDLTTAQCHLPSQVPGGQLARQPELAKSDFFTRPLPAAGITALVSGVERFLATRPAGGAGGGVALDSCGGAINRVHPAATAYVHRDALFLAQYTTVWTPGAGGPAGGAGRQRDWLRATHQSMRPYASGQAYQNYIDPDLASWRQAYYGANYPRLQQIKKAYDPGQLFRFPQGITPA